MNTKSDNRAVLAALIEKLDTPDMMQLLAFAAGYEAGKASAISDTDTDIHNQSPPSNHSA